MCPEAVGTSSRESGGGRGSGDRRPAAGVSEAPRLSAARGSEILVEAGVAEDEADAADLLVDGLARAADEGGDVALGDGFGEEDAELALERGEVRERVEEVEGEAGGGGGRAGVARGAGRERVEERYAGLGGVERGVEGNGEEVRAALPGEFAPGERGEVVAEDLRHIGALRGAAALAEGAAAGVPEGEAAGEEEVEAVPAEAGPVGEVSPHLPARDGELPVGEETAPAVGHRSAPCFFALRRADGPTLRGPRGRGHHGGVMDLRGGGWTDPTDRRRLA